MTKRLKKPLVDSWNWIGEQIGNTDLAKATVEYATGAIKDLDEWGAQSPAHEALAMQIKALPEAVLGALSLNASEVFAGGTRWLGGKVYGRARKQRYDKREDKVREALKPEDFQERGQTKATGRFDRIIYDPTEADEELYRVLSAVDEFKPDRTATYNRDVLYGRATKDAEKLSARLEKFGDIEIDVNGLADDIRGAIDDMVTSPEFVALQVPEKQIIALADIADNILRKAPNNPLGVHNARKEIDREFKRILKDKYYKDEDTITNKDQVLSILRNGINARLFESVPDVDVQTMLRRQHLILKAAARMGDKAKNEAPTAFGRMLAQLHKDTGMHVSPTPLGIGGTLTFGAYLGGKIPDWILVGGAGLAGAAALGRSIIKSPHSKEILARGLLGMGTLIKKAKVANDMMLYNQLIEMRDEAKMQYEQMYGVKPPLKEAYR